MIDKITLLVAIDAQHEKELAETWPTWMKYKPEMRQMSMVVLYDPEQVNPKTTPIDHPNARFVPCLEKAENQRAKMLTGLVRASAQEIHTPWYLKIDTDTMALAPGTWIKPEWFEPDSSGRLPVYIASPWGYSKPANVIDLFDDWGDTVPELAKRPRLNFPYKEGSDLVRCQRIISWLFFGQTAWTKKVVSWCPGKLPFPSQDTYMYYCAQRLGEYTVRERMTKYNWVHSRLKNLIRIKQTLG